MLDKNMQNYLSFMEISQDSYKFYKICLQIALRNDKQMIRSAADTIHIPYGHWRYDTYSIRSHVHDLRFQN